VLEETPVVLVSAFGARPVTGREGCCIVEEEEAGVAAGRHWLPPASSELEPASDPSAAVVVPANPAILVVESAAVAEDESSFAGLDQLSERRDSVPQGHRTIFPDVVQTSRSMSVNLVAAALASGPAAGVT
jgi:hypothetical protein